MRGLSPTRSRYRDVVQPDKPSWVGAVLADVERAFETTGADTPGWPDPHQEREPLAEEYSRCLDRDKYRILDARVDAWIQVLEARGVVHAQEGAPGLWLDAPRPGGELRRERRLVPHRDLGLVLVLAGTLVAGEPFGLDVGVSSDGITTALLDVVPPCGCDACDGGSAELLDSVDGWVLTIARGGLVHARSENGRVTRTFDGWQSSGREDHRDWLDDSSPLPDGVQRWAGTPWL